MEKKLHRYFPCPYCHGRPRYVDVTTDDGLGPEEWCTACNGTGDGRVYVAREAAKGEKCKACEGTGYGLGPGTENWESVSCSYCSGTGYGKKGGDVPPHTDADCPPIEETADGLTEAMLNAAFLPDTWEEIPATETETTT